MSTRTKSHPLVSRRKFLAEATTFLGGGVAASMLGVTPTGDSRQLPSAGPGQGTAQGEDEPIIYAENLQLGYGAVSPTQHRIGIHTFLGGSPYASGFVLSASDFSGADEAAKIAAAINALPLDGGIIYSCGGVQLFGKDVFQSVTKPVKLVLLPGTHRFAVSATIPPAITLDFQPGAFFCVDIGLTLTIKGNICIGQPHVEMLSGFGNRIWRRFTSGKVLVSLAIIDPENWTTS